MTQMRAASDLSWDAAAHLTAESAELEKIALLERVEALLPGIRARTSEAERLRRLPDDTITELADAGVFRMHAPADRGGLQLEVDALYEVALLLGTACTSTAWTATFLAVHNAVVARFDSTAQDEVFGDRPFALAAGSFHPLPGSQGVAVDGGLMVTGRWDFCSGIMHAGWAFVDVPVEATSDGMSNRYVCLVPVSDLTVHDVWHTTGMRGTGSNDVELRGVFVPSHRALPTPIFHGLESPGALMRPDFTLLRMPFYRAAGIFHPAFAIGSAERALQVFRDEVVARRVRPVSGSRLVESPLVQSRFGRAAHAVDIAKLLGASQASDAGRHYATHVSDPELDDRARMRLNSVGAIHRAAEAVDLVLRASGGSIFREGSELERISRDMSVLLNHNSGDWDFHTETAGSVLLGLAPAPATSGVYRAL